jgi:hypothetical protein
VKVLNGIEAENMIEYWQAFLAGVLVGTTALNIYELHYRRKAWRTLTLGLDDFDIKCINEEYARKCGKWQK